MVTRTQSMEEEEPQDARIVLEPLRDSLITARVTGVTPVIPHAWSEKAKLMMAEKQQQAATTTTRRKREPKNPEEEARDSCYWLNGKGAMPAVAFKAAMVGACRFYEGITMTQAKQLFYVEGEGAQQLVALEGDPEMREDTPRNSGGVADLRYRMQFWPWAATLRIRYLPTMIDTGSVLALLDAGGRGGVGDWRPSAPKSATGTYGQFRVDGEEVTDGAE